MKDLNHYRFLAELFRYPSGQLRVYATLCKDIIDKYDPGLKVKYDPFYNFINENTLALAQEYYTRTFDVQAQCFLDIGYVMFGEDYKRGVFLVNMKSEQIKAYNSCGSELPDHLPNMLTLLPKIRDPEFAEELAFSIMIPALHEMISKFRGAGSLYKNLLEILVAIMHADYPVSTFGKFIFAN